MRIGIDARKISDFGIGTYIRGLLGGLDELATGDHYVVFAPAAARARIPPSFEHRILEVPHYSFREPFVVGRAADRAELDLFHAPHYVLPHTRVPLVVTIHDLIHLRVPHRNPLAALYARFMLRRAVRLSRTVLTVSEAVRRDIERVLHRDSVVTPNGIDSRFSVAGPRAERSYFLYVGNDKPHKNVETLVAAHRSVRAERPGVNLLLVGADFTRFANESGIVCAGFVGDDELAPLYRGAIALVMPSREEGFGLPAAEAMASGTAVITSDQEALVEVTGDAALHVTAGDPSALAAAMKRLANDAGLRETLGAAGARQAARFTWRRCAELTHAAYAAAARSR